jgi:hypothetical protein
LGETDSRKKPEAKNLVTLSLLNTRSDDLFLSHGNLIKSCGLLVLFIKVMQLGTRSIVSQGTLLTITKIINKVIPLPYFFGVVSPVEEGKICLLVAQEGMARVSLQLDRYPIHVQASPFMIFNYILVKQCCGSGSVGSVFFKAS